MLIPPSSDAATAAVAEDSVRQVERGAAGSKNSPHLFCAILVLAFLLLCGAKAQDDQPTVISYKSARVIKRITTTPDDYLTYATGTTDTVEDGVNAQDSGQALLATASASVRSHASLSGRQTQVVTEQSDNQDKPVNKSTPGDLQEGNRESRQELDDSNFSVSTADTTALNNSSFADFTIDNSTQSSSAANADLTTQSIASTRGFDNSRSITRETSSDPDEHVQKDKHTYVVALDSSTEDTSKATQEPLSHSFIVSGGNFTTKTSQVTSTDSSLTSSSLSDRGEQHSLSQLLEKSLESNGLHTSTEETTGTEISSSKVSEATESFEISKRNQTEFSDTIEPIIEVTPQNQRLYSSETSKENTYYIIRNTEHQPPESEAPSTLSLGHTTKSAHEPSIKTTVHQSVFGYTSHIQVATSVSPSLRQQSTHSASVLQTTTQPFISTSSTISTPSSSTHEVPFQAHSAHEQPALELTPNSQSLTSIEPSLSSVAPPLISSEPTLTSIEPSLSSIAQPLISSEPALTSVEPPLSSVEPQQISSEPSLTSVFASIKASSSGPKQDTVSHHLSSSFITSEEDTAALTTSLYSLMGLITTQEITTESETTADAGVTSFGFFQSSIFPVTGSDDVTTLGAAAGSMGSSVTGTAMSPCPDSTRSASEDAGPHDHLYALAFHITLGLCVSMSVVIICFFGALVCYAKYRGWKKRMNVLPTVIVGDKIEKGASSDTTTTNKASSSKSNRVADRPKSIIKP